MLIVVHAASVVAVGGDVMPAFRFFAPMVPLLALAASLALGGLFGPKRSILSSARRVVANLSR